MQGRPRAPSQDAPLGCASSLLATGVPSSSHAVARDVDCYVCRLDARIFRRRCGRCRCGRCRFRLHGVEDGLAIRLSLDHEENGQQQEPCGDRGSGNAGNCARRHPVARGLIRICGFGDGSDGLAEGGGEGGAREARHGVGHGRGGLGSVGLDLDCHDDTSTGVRDKDRGLVHAQLSRHRGLVLRLLRVGDVCERAGEGHRELGRVPRCRVQVGKRKVVLHVTELEAGDTLVGYGGLPFGGQRQEDGFVVQRCEHLGVCGLASGRVQGGG
mmetsp:Transcript_26240/g.70043  ORF Transcript_26240/g.70043 Transcript_26240/m.70043 type:complete len:270 (-) Transcript_26240:55-864(-)